MTYTLWSRGRLLGSSELDYVRTEPRVRWGALQPAEGAEALLAIAAGVPEAGIALGRMLRDGARDESMSTEARCAAIHGLTEYADLAAAFVHRDALELELRGPDGAVIPTEDVDVRDTEFLLSLAGEEHERDWWDDLDAMAGEAPDLDAAPLDESDLLDEPEFDWAAELEEFEEREFPRYQITVVLRDEAAIP